MPTIAHEDVESRARHERVQGIAATLVEALPYVRRWAGETVVVKYGGSAMGSEALAQALVGDLVLLQSVGVRVVLVHGGGKAVSAMQARLGMTSEFVDGLRVTTPETMEVAQMVQVGSVSRSLLSEISRQGGRGIGLSGQDGGGWLRAEKRAHRTANGEPVDLGRVGNVTSVDTDMLLSMLGSGLIPVVAPVAVDAELTALNVNADTVATAVATALGAARLLLLTDVPHVMGPDGPVSQASTGELQQWMDDGVISGGMVPKAEACLAALCGGVGGVAIVDGLRAHAVLVELLTRAGSGTLITPDEPAVGADK